MGSVLSTFVQDYNDNFSYRLPSHIPMDDSSDEEEQFIVYSRVDARIVTIFVLEWFLSPLRGSKVHLLY